MNSTPGCCILAKLGSTNAQVFKWDGVSMDPDRLTYVRAVVRQRMLSLLENPVADPLNVFVKPEPHSAKKMEEGRYRLISAVSLVDTLVDRVLFGWLGRAALETVGRTPCLVGWSPISGGWRQLKALYRGRVLCLDKSAWDWSVQSWMVDMWRSFVKQLAYGHSDWWGRMVDERFRLLFEDATFQFKDGTRVSQGSPGIMKSGCYLTIILNSVGQSFVHYLANMAIGKEPTQGQPHTIGDDTVQSATEDIDDYVRAIKDLGFRVKGARVRDNPEFAGFCFGSTCWPAYWQKHLFSLTYVDDLEEVLRSYMPLYVNEPVMFNLLRRVAFELNPATVLTVGECREIMNGA